MFTNANVVEFGSREVAKIEVLQNDGVTYKTWYEKIQRFKIVSYTIENNPYDLSYPNKLPVITVVCNGPIDHAYTEQGSSRDPLQNRVTVNDNICTIEFSYRGYKYFSDICFVPLTIYGYNSNNDMGSAGKNFKIDLIRAPIELHADDIYITIPYKGSVEDYYFPYQLYDTVNEREIYYGQGCIETIYNWEDIYAEHGYTYDTYYDLSVQNTDISDDVYNTKVPVHITLIQEDFSIINHYDSTIYDIYSGNSPYVHITCNRGISSVYIMPTNFIDDNPFSYELSIEGDKCYINFYKIGYVSDDGYYEYDITLYDAYDDNVTHHVRITTTDSTPEPDQYGYCYVCDRSIPNITGGGLCEDHAGYWCCEHGNWHSPDEYCACGGSGNEDHGNYVQCWYCGEWVPPGGICSCERTQGH